MTKFKKKWRCYRCGEVAGLYVAVWRRFEPESPNSCMKVGRRTHVCYNHFMDFVNEFIRTNSSTTSVLDC